MEFEFTAELIHWRGPSPYHFLAVPEARSREIDDVAASVTYGWGMVPVTVRSGSSEWATSLWPKDGRYLVPVKAAVRRAEGLELGDEVTVTLTLTR